MNIIIYDIRCALLKRCKMNYLSVYFFVFIIFFTIIYYVVKPQYRYIAIFIGSYIFYGYANIKMLLVLALITLISYIGGLMIGKWEGRGKTAVYAVSFLLEIVVLAVFKYTSFILDNVNYLSDKLFGTTFSINWGIVLPIGLSFIIFQSCNYLSEVYRGKVKAEKNIIRYASFVAFFPTVLSGPIQKARNLLPQITSPKAFDYEQAKKGTLLFIWGAFEKIMVANRLNAIYMSILSNYSNKSSAELLIGAICFSLYIYADFSSYSDMARGIAKIMGIEVGKNFNNPYLSQSTSEFWRRWHISLNDWFIENIYIPLGGNRKGVVRKYINVFIVFFISGLWHGANWHFVAWGMINGIFVIIGQILKPFKKRIYKKLNIDESVESIVFIRRVIVFFLITFTWVFFTSGVMDSLKILKRIILFNYLSIFNPELLNVGGTAVVTFITLVATIFFCWIQLKRQDEHKAFEVYNRQPFFLQCLSVALMVFVCVFGACATDVSVDTQFVYFQF